MAPDDPDRYDYLTDLFSVLSNETRLEILDVLWNNRADDGAQESLTFSELRKRVGAATEEGFNYHLDKLAGTLVTREIDPGDGYKLTYVGMFLAQVMNGGVLRPSIEKEGGPYPLEETCMYCEHSLVATVRLSNHPIIDVVCENCSQRYFSAPVHESPVTGDNVKGLLRRITESLSWTTNLRRQGVCWLCTGPITQRIETDVETLSKLDSKATFNVLSFCEQCGHGSWSNITSHVQRHPEVIRFCMERGVDPTNDAGAYANGTGVEPDTSLVRTTIDTETTVAETDPLRVRATVVCEGDELHLTLDESATVVDVTESTATGDDEEDGKPRSPEGQ